MTAANVSALLRLNFSMELSSVSSTVYPPTNTTALHIQYVWHSVLKGAEMECNIQNYRKVKTFSSPSHSRLLS